MKQSTCPRTWEVEAARDGRLSGEAVAGFADHRNRCQVCSAHATWVEQLATSLRASRTEGLDDVSLRRLRQAVLESADAALVRPQRSRKPFRAKVTCAAVGLAALCYAALVGLRHVVSSHAAPTASVAQARPSVVIEALSGTTWHEQSAAKARRFVLEIGTLRFAISRSSSDSPVVVDVPDGELEDEGTRFSVTVAAERTMSIRVDEGAVVFRRTDGTAIRVVAGESWLATPGQVLAPAGVLGSRTKPSVVVAGTAPVATEGGVFSRASAKPKKARTRAFGDSDPRPRTEMVESKTGRSPPIGEAVNQDAQEDLVYLRIVALASEGRGSEAAVLAQEYLRRFPSGFRRVEVARIAAER